MKSKLVVLIVISSFILLAPITRAGGFRGGGGGFHGGHGGGFHGGHGGFHGHGFHGGNCFFGSGFAIGFGFPFYYGSFYPYGYYPYGGYPYGYSYGAYPYGYSYDGYYGYSGDSPDGSDRRYYRNGVYPSHPVDRTDAAVVARVQRRLARAGVYRGAIDGVLGDRTIYAIRVYERMHGLPVDGRIDGQLLAVLD